MQVLAVAYIARGMFAVVYNTILR